MLNATMLPRMSGHSKVETRYPHIAKNLVALWGTPACLSYIEGILWQDRVLDREGLEYEAFSELLALYYVIIEKAHRKNEKNHTFKIYQW